MNLPISVYQINLVIVVVVVIIVFSKTEWHRIYILLHTVFGEMDFLFQNLNLLLIIAKEDNVVIHKTCYHCLLLYCHCYEMISPGLLLQ